LREKKATSEPATRKDMMNRINTMNSNTVVPATEVISKRVNGILNKEVTV
jgi:hypothetical protein